MFCGFFFLTGIPLYIPQVPKYPEGYIGMASIARLILSSFLDVNIDRVCRNLPAGHYPKVLK